MKVENMSLAQDEITGVRGGVMNGMLTYAQPLRAIGQALETLNIQSFEMEPMVDGFFVRGTVPLASKESLNDSLASDKLRMIWGQLPKSTGPEDDPVKATHSSVLSWIELLYTEKDVERLEEEGRARRVDPRGTANPSTLSQVLRCLGAYLNQKRARLVKISRESESVSLEYETSLGTNMRETLSVSDVYDLWVRMYLQRSEREL
jgi:hypothetical protein